jgi:hypothetical protein
MDTRELRKGNWLILKEEVEKGKITEKYTQVETTNGDKINDIEMTHYNPVPLTSHVLRQIGFSKEKETDELEMIFLKFTVDENPNYRFKAKKELGSDSYQLALFLGDHQLWPWINTVHELQNYLFVQNGQEIDLSFDSKES